MESIFNPNKATQKQLSSKGTEIDIMALILYTLYPVQEPMIYLEERGGMIRDYSITLIIDNSKSCLSSFNKRHSLLTIINFLKIIYSMDIPSFDLIITNKENENPYILLFDNPSINIFKNNSLFEQAIIILSNPILNTNLPNAIKSAYDLKKMKKTDKESYLFILTDGLYHKHYENEIVFTSKLCEKIGMKVFGIGLGIYPYKAKELFETFIYSENPDYLLNAISKIFGKIIKTETELSLLSDEQKEINFEEIFTKLKNNNVYFYNKLKKELEEKIKKIEEEEERKKKEEEERKKKEEEERLRKVEEMLRKLKKKEILKRQFELRNDQKLIQSKNDEKNIEKVKEVLEHMCILGRIMKEEILEEKQKNPEKFISIEEAIKEEKKNEGIFCLGLLAKNLENLGITTAIEKIPNQEEESEGASNTVLQFIMNGMIEKKKYDLHFDCGEERNKELLNNKNEQEKFNKKLRKKISLEYNIPEEEIILTNPQKGSYHIQLIFQTNDFNDDSLNLDKLKDKCKNDKEFGELSNLKQVHKSLIMEGCKLSKDMVDARGNRKSGWGVGEKRGGFKYTPPFKGWIGYGLKVWDRYDGTNNDWLAYNGNKNEWAVAYHGIGVKLEDNFTLETATKSIIVGGFKAGKGQYYKNDDDARHPGNKVGIGVYCSPDPKVMEEYAKGSKSETIVNGKKFIMGFMMRVKPDKIRYSKSKPDYWVLNGTTDEMRPYRIMVKEC